MSKRKKLEDVEKAIDNVAGEVRECVKNADVAPVVHAYWIEDWKCSARGEPYEVAPYDETDPNECYVYSDYCPNCGAKMGGTPCE